MIQRARRGLVALSVAGLVIAGACGGDSDAPKAASGAVSATTTTTPTTTTTTTTTAHAHAVPTTTVPAAPATTMPTTTTTVAPAASPPPTSAPGPAQVQIAAFAFGPSPARIRIGQAVMWTNTDAVAHSIQDTSALATPVGPSLAQGESFSITYPKSGTFSYICGIHPSMEGSVEVAR